MLTQYRLSSISNEVSATKSREVSLNGTVHDFFTLLQFYWLIWHIKHSKVFNDKE